MCEKTKLAEDQRPTEPSWTLCALHPDRAFESVEEDRACPWCALEVLRGKYDLALEAIEDARWVARYFYGLAGLSHERLATSKWPWLATAQDSKRKAPEDTVE